MTCNKHLLIRHHCRLV